MAQMRAELIGAFASVSSRVETPARSKRKARVRVSCVTLVGRVRLFRSWNLTVGGGGGGTCGGESLSMCNHFSHVRFSDLFFRFPGTVNHTAREKFLRRDE